MMLSAIVGLKFFAKLKIVALIRGFTSKLFYFSNALFDFGEMVWVKVKAEGRQNKFHWRK